MADRENPTTNPDAKYVVIIWMVPPLTPGDTNVSYEDSPWGITIILERVPLSFIKQGLYWTTGNIDILNGRLQSWKTEDPEVEYQRLWTHEFRRCWTIKEFPNKPISECGWVGNVLLGVNDPDTLCGFSLGNLRRQLIHYVCVEDEQGKIVFNFDPEDKTKSLNRLPLEGDPFDLRWVWPMESVVPDGSGTGSGPLDSGRVKGRLGDVEDRLGRLHLGMDERNTTSWKDVVVLAARSESLRMVVRGISWLFLSALIAGSVLVLSFAALFVVVAFRRGVRP
ncbi:hypothetical protein QBC34DRAFT_402633 [Podospora aff. communis PSN243]|uniref:Uncharacterized protein n=1 Tax=Podospora aff. communis PSN243 TaxID=3040156 RepID=A0AAV9GS67_9PEZI|nr:hypothetical protein QBC34DRAFT_402633 [Podospora aff. communis PSN243]